MKTNGQSRLTIFLLLASLLVGVVCAFGWIVKPLLWGADSASKSVFFDSFNVLNTTFSGLAFAGVVFAILLQRKELSLQREELEATREELHRSAVAQEHSQEALNQQVVALRDAAKISLEAMQPQVIVYADADESRPTIILLMIENIGGGVAKNVRFRYPKTLPAHAWGIEALQQSGPTPSVMDHGPLATGIPFLPPGGKRKLTWGQYGGLRDTLGEGPVEITAEFDNSIGQKLEPIVSLVDVKSFEFTDAADADGARQSAQHLEKIARDLGHVVSGFKPPVVLIQSRASYRREQQEQHEKAKARMEQMQKVAKPPAESPQGNVAPADGGASDDLQVKAKDRAEDVSQINSEWRKRV